MDDNKEPNESKALETAWQHLADLSRNAERAQNLYYQLSGWVIVVGILATLLAIVFNNELDPFIALDYNTLLILLTLLPIVGSVILAFANKNQFGERWLTFRSGAEEIRKSIFEYRTLLWGNANRDNWLSEKVAIIQRQIIESSGGDMVIRPYKGPLPHRYNPNNPKSDPGFNNLLPEEYITYRLQNQIDWHNKKLIELQNNRTRFQIAIYFFGGLGTLLASLGSVNPELPIWVAVTSSLSAALTNWTQIQQMDGTIQNYSKLTIELGIIRDQWYSLTKTTRTGDQYFKMVIAVEKLLWTEHNKYVSEMRQTIDELRTGERDLLELVMNAPAPEIFDDMMKELGETAIESTAVPTEMVEGKKEPATVSDGSTPLPDKKPTKPERGRPHAFAVMPFGRKPGLDGNWIDFDTIYQTLIKPALEEAGFEAFRADEETVSGDILTDMFQELLLADLVIADMSINNANVFYELGVRHAFRKRGVVHIQAGRAYMPFDVFNVRTIPYHLDSSGRPDPAEIDKDIQTIVRVCIDTYKSDRDAIHSPVFNLLTGLEEPDRRDLRTPLATGFWREYHEWQERMEIAKRKKRIGDVLLLTEEISNPLIKEEAIGEAGRALRSLGRHELAIKQYRQGQDINPQNLNFRREEAFHLNRVGRTDEAIVKLENLLDKDPTDTEAIAALGRIYRDMWSESWAKIKNEDKRIHEAYQSAHWLIKSVHTYLRGYRIDQNKFYPGINALTWSVVLDHLANKFNDNQDPDIEEIRSIIPQLRGAVQFSLEAQTGPDTTDFWALASLAELMVTTAEDPEDAARAYRKSLTAAKKNTFYLKSSLGQLKVLDSLDFRPKYVDAGRFVLLEELDRIQEEPGAQKDEHHDHKKGEEEGMVYLFSGHMIDEPDWPQTTFPPEMEGEARDRISQALNKLKANKADMGITVGAAAGGDILFIEECLKHGMRVEILLPYDEPDYINKLISVIGDDWVTRYYAIRNHVDVTIRMQLEQLGEPKDNDNMYERNNRWGLYSALIYGIDRARMIVLWNGETDDDAGYYSQIVSKMVQEMRGIGGIVEHINSSKFDYFKKKNGRKRGPKPKKKELKEKTKTKKNE